MDFGIHDKCIRKYSSDKGLGDNLDKTSQRKMELEFLVYPFGFLLVLSAFSAVVFLLEISRGGRGSSRRGPGNRLILVE